MACLNLKRKYFFQDLLKYEPCIHASLISFKFKIVQLESVWNCM